MKTNSMNTMKAIATVITKGDRNTSGGTFV